MGVTVTTLGPMRKLRLRRWRWGFHVPHCSGGLGDLGHSVYEGSRHWRQQKPHSCSDYICGSAPILLNVDKQRTYFHFKECPCGSDHYNLDLGLQQGMDSGEWEAWGKGGHPSDSLPGSFAFPALHLAYWFPGGHHLQLRGPQSTRHVAGQSARRRRLL